MDLPPFGDSPGQRRRAINLGGSTSQTTQSALLQEARARRQQRNDLKRKQDSATKIQSWWRGRQQARFVREQMRALFQDNATNITGLRCVVLIGSDDLVLAKWSSAMLADGGALLLQATSDPTWMTLLRRVSVLLLQSVSVHPLSNPALLNVQVLSLMLSQQCPAGFTLVLLHYLLNNGYYRLLGRAVSQIPPSSKSTPILPLLVTLLAAPFTSIDTSSEHYLSSLEDFIIYILTIPILPNRLPLNSLTYLAPRIPLSNIHIVSAVRISTSISSTQSIPESHIHLLANLCAFAPPRYNALTVEALTAYLRLTTEILNTLPTHALEPPKTDTSVQQSWGDVYDSEDDSPTQVEVVSSFAPKPYLPELDNKTLTRLQTLPSPNHLNSLLAACHKHRSQQTRSALFGWCQALCTVWPSRKDKVVSSVVAWSGGGLVRELYRNYVRSSPLGQDSNPTALTDPAHASHWPPLLFLVDLYNQALLTMGDDEFFSSSSVTISAAALSSSSSASSAVAARNPLTLDELTSFSRQLLNIAFTLYWKEDPTNVQNSSVPGILNLKWEAVRERLTKLLQAIHARDSRQPFMPPDHWLVTSQLDIGPFVEAAVFEEREISGATEGTRQTRAMSQRQIALISPRLGVLNNIPFAIPFDVRVSIFRNFVQNDMATRGLELGRERYRNMTRVTVRRGSIAQDGFDRLDGVDLKGPIAITFIDQFGQEEAGIDGGGVFKEFLTSLCMEVFDSDRGLWLATKKNELYPNPHSYATEPHSLAWYRFIGRILGKALYEGILVDVAFAGFFLAKWLGKQSFLDDLASLDPELYQGLVFLKHYTGNPEELSLNFAVAMEEFGVTRNIPLMPDGEQIPVTRENRLQYIYLVSHYRLNKQIKKQSDAFFEGLSEMIDPKWLRMFNQQELQILLGGVNSPIDLDDLRSHTQYGGLYGDHEPTIQIFWKVVQSFNQDQRRGLLRFATSCSRPPLLGFKELVPNFAIRDSGADQARLPTASTCVNLLKLPRYRSEQVLREKLLQAIQSNAGFDLS
ncbi:hypothetical protein PHLCEN_2v10437 [Hermanssonia centrifuga]|uniref:HECT-type E3 ubiquitin transferase n=1 Tax=Hermanssonia centrifuga TaxID=98765 RepID=A0A2R6NMU3_9APHY|nr:hypothetical protein PHLCEN_2v10437 [Hermanssonia centrifuga]